MKQPRDPGSENSFLGQHHTFFLEESLVLSNKHQIVQKKDTSTQLQGAAPRITTFSGDPQAVGKKLSNPAHSPPLHTQFPCPNFDMASNIDSEYEPCLKKMLQEIDGAKTQPRGRWLILATDYIQNDIANPIRGTD